MGSDEPHSTVFESYGRWTWSGLRYWSLTSFTLHVHVLFIPDKSELMSYALHVCFKMPRLIFFRVYACRYSFIGCADALSQFLN
jgi:hypothetical protein